MARVSKKRSDHRWKAPDGTIWASRFEWEVFDALRKESSKRGYSVRQCDERDSVGYATGVRAGRCTGCGSSAVVQERRYTPDLYLWTADESSGFYLEVKGHMRPARRAQLAAMLKQHPQLDLRFIIKSTRTRATNKLAMWEYIDRYFKRPWVEWQGELPDAWIES